LKDFFDVVGDKKKELFLSLFNNLHPICPQFSFRKRLKEIAFFPVLEMIL